ncbi:hypothetical protein FJT64_003246 [Amphibalanus amphitrite]|uniref:Uncharacterized protein n=1 Tax=Amphibalanus amphitrite TaxID=1232801 RepID=A0A6A4WFJ1_AMPAM|nr:hypothetical protein FJT64_003246 [Amphibalanus amphitrite]
MDGRQFAGGIGVTTVIAVLSAAAIGTLLSGFAVTTFTGATNALGFNASTLVSDTSELYQRVTGADDDESGGLLQAAVTRRVPESGARLPRRAVCLSERVSPQSANLNLAFSGDGAGATTVEGQLHGAPLRNVSYPMLVLSALEGCGGVLKRSSHLAHHPLDLPSAGTGLVREIPRERFNGAVLDQRPRTVWLLSDGRPVPDACCAVRLV